MALVAASAVGAWLYAMWVNRDRDVVISAFEIARKYEPGFDPSAYHADRLVRSRNGAYWRVRLSPKQTGAKRPVNVVVPNAAQFNTDP
jgi:hypothetical protein